MLGKLMTRAFLPVALLFTGGAAQAEEAFKLEARPGHFVATGTLVEASPGHIDAVRRAHRDIKLLVMQFVPGSDDNNQYLAAAYKLRLAGISTYLPADGLIASGGTDFFLAGVTRVIEPGACVGVHSWDDPGPPAYAATDLPRQHEDHEDFLEYFTAIGIDPEFYWFTISAASSSDMHWMSPAEINRFSLSSIPLPEDGTETDAERKERCENR